MIVPTSQSCPKSFLLAGQIRCCDFAKSPLFIQNGAPHTLYPSLRETLERRSHEKSIQKVLVNSEGH